MFTHRLEKAEIKDYQAIHFEPDDKFPDFDRKNSLIIMIDLRVT